MRTVGGLGTAPRLRTLDPRPQTLLKGVNDTGNFLDLASSGYDIIID